MTPIANLAISLYLVKTVYEEQDAINERMRGRSNSSDKSGYGKSEGRQLMASDCSLLYRSEQARRSSSLKAALSRGKKARSCYCANHVIKFDAMHDMDARPQWSPAMQDG